MEEKAHRPSRLDHRDHPSVAIPNRCRRRNPGSLKVDVKAGGRRLTLQRATKMGLDRISASGEKSSVRFSIGHDHDLELTALAEVYRLS